MQNSICPYFREQGILLGDLKPAHIEKYYEFPRKSGLSNNTIIRHHANLHKALAEDCRKDLIPFNSESRVQRPKTEDFISNPYTVEEANLLLEAVRGGTLKLVVTLTLFYGLRRGEVLGLRWSAVDFEKDTITIN